MAGKDKQVGDWRFQIYVFFGTADLYFESIFSGERYSYQLPI
jgi:hypothetical protein